MSSELTCFSHPSFYLNDQFHLLSVNPSGQRWLVLSEGSDHSVDWDKGRGPSLRHVLNKARQTLQNQQEVLMGDEDGNPRFHLILVQVLEGPEGPRFHLQILPLQDESLRQLAQEGVLAAERVSLALRSRQVGFWDWNVRDNILIWDKTQYELFGIDPRDFRNAYEAWESTLSPESKDKAIYQVQLALEGKQNYNTEFEIVTRHGEKRTLRGSAVCLTDEKGKVIRMIGLNWDVTHRRRLEKQILEQGRLTSKITDMIPTFIAIRDLSSNRLTYFNRRLPEMLDFDYENFLDITADQLAGMVHPEDRQSFVSFLQQNSQMGDDDVKDLEIRATTRKGRLIWVQLRSKIFERDPSGRPLSIITVGTESTEKKQLELEAEAGRAKAFHSAKLAALGEMAGGIAHEINNPLTIIFAKVEQVRKKLQQLGIQEESLFVDIDRIQAVCQRIAKIIRSMRTLSRTEDGEAVQPILISNLLDEVLILCHQRLSKLNIRFEMAPPPPISVELRQIQVSQILLNLLNNAIDAVENMKERWIHVGFEYNEDQFKIILTDSGPGIPPETAQKMTEPFFTTKEVGKGTGLGLSISLAIAERHHGSLHYDSSSSNTRFILTLPRRQMRKENS